MEIQVNQIKELRADEAVVDNMSEYQNYLATSKLPHPIDGLKDVSRRAIYVMGTNKDSVKCAQFISSIMKLHPHGDGSIRGVVERLFRQHDVGIPLITCHGNSGTYSTPPAAPRYTDVTSTEYARDLFFNHVHSSTIPMKYTIEYNEMEPKYFIPRLPTALLFGNLTIGAGFKSVTIPLHLNSVCELVQKYIDHTKKGMTFTGYGYGHLFIPEFPTDCELRNYDALVDAYNQGAFNAKIVTDGVMEMDKHGYDLLNMPALTPYSSMVTKFIELMQTKSFWMNNLIKNVQNNLIGENYTKERRDGAGELSVLFKNNVDVWNILDQFKRIIRFTGSVTPIPNYEVEGVPIAYTPVQILHHWYKARYQSIVNGLNATQNQLLKDKLVTDALLCIVDDKDKVVEILKTSKTKNEAIHKLSTEFDITNNQANNLCRASLDRLIEASRDELIANSEKINKDIDIVRSKYTSIDNTIYEDATYFNNKYRRPRKTVIPKYIGYLKVGSKGIYQYTSAKDMFNTINTQDVTGIYQYKSLSSPKILLGQNSIPVNEEFRSIPRQNTGTGIIEKLYSDRAVRTIVYLGDSVSYMEGYVIPKDDTRVQYVTDKFIGFHNNGVIEQCSTSDYSLKKSICAGPKHSLIYAYSDKQMCKNKVVVYMSTSPGYMNEVFFTKIYDKDTDTYNKMLTTPPHEMIVLDVVDASDENKIINIPRACVNVNISYLNITDITKIINTFSTTSVNVRTGSYVSTDGDKVKPSRHPDCNTMVVL